ncbi:MAG: hypothetical protein A2V69_00900 [Candidatus Portnoybacteria bacterium RBG_13_40_8]|uniref:Uncharacterized protein n=1 Tax=Candidatus Portnoybacteria bacterium RBG_13_40_8 TaxID=1801990 RepID=A0A1G2F3G4_9BACT|nr:MAG: hypothetical protein A2V69_00900 [Candidatus Portnoybacteria bacterium RBG_13_40_8]OGZ35460.1 MAG: hypothetical protein A2V60_03425 [Candidatus Portnoybacteria bacterium RIFCSPHIGHO2_01_FULL_39_19]
MYKLFLWVLGFTIERRFHPSWSEGIRACLPDEVRAGLEKGKLTLKNEFLRNIDPGYVPHEGETLYIELAE